MTGDGLVFLVPHDDVGDGERVHAGTPQFLFEVEGIMREAVVRADDVAGFGEGVLIQRFG